MPGRLPNFLVIGAMKSGTSSLAAYLDAHPDVWLAPTKELHFFDDPTNWAQGVDWYRDRFADAGSAPAVGEATPAYLFHPEGPARMAAVVPDARLIVVLRNPVDRAYSHYWHHRSNGKETRPFAEAVEVEGRRREQGERLEHWYLARGRYLGQLERVLEHFPRTQLHVLLFDDLQADAAAATSAVCGFLGLPAHAPPNAGEAYNPASELRFRRLWLAMFRYRLWRFVPRPLHASARALFRKPITYPKLDPALRADLSERFRADDEALGAWLGRDLISLWHAPVAAPDAEDHPV